jgi:hypothetical protein
MPTRAERIEGGLIGLLVGDALGVPYEFSNRCKNLLLSCILSRTSAGRWVADETIAARRS